MIRSRGDRPCWRQRFCQYWFQIVATRLLLTSIARFWFFLKPSVVMLSIDWSLVAMPSLMVKLLTSLQCQYWHSQLKNSERSSLGNSIENYHPSSCTVDFDMRVEHNIPLPCQLSIVPTVHLPSMRTFQINIATSKKPSLLGSLSWGSFQLWDAHCFLTFSFLHNEKKKTVASAQRRRRILNPATRGRR